MRPPTPRETIDPAGAAWPRQYAALAHTSRLAIVDALSRGPRATADLARELDRPVEQLGYHVARLLQAGWIRAEADRRRPGGRQVVYGAARPRWGADSVAAAIERSVPNAPVAGGLVEVFDSVSRAARAGQISRRTDYHVSRHPMLLDAEAQRELADRTAAFVARARAIVGAADARSVQRSGGDRIEVDLVHVQHAKSLDVGR